MAWKQLKTRKYKGHTIKIWRTLLESEFETTYDYEYIISGKYIRTTGRVAYCPDTFGKDNVKGLMSYIKMVIDGKIKR